MSHINRRRGDTRMQIIRVGAKHFIEDGYTRSTMKRISRELDLSPGNITFYFPTKDHLLAVLINELFGFQSIMMKRAVEDGKSPILEYCLELAAIAATCAEDEVAADLYSSAYTSPYTLDLIRKNGTKKAKAVFGDYCKDFSEADWTAAETLVSGIEYGVIMTYGEKSELRLVIEKALNSIMALYGVPDHTRAQNIDCVLSFDYRGLGKRILGEFREYVDKTNEIGEI